jgi:type IV pilus assembly protein PilX
MNEHTSRPVPTGQRGAALVVGLVLLLVLTLLAVTGMATASLELQMAGNAQYRERAFQAAEAGIERAIQAGAYDTASTIGTYVPSGDPDVPPTPQRGTGVRGCMRTIDIDGAASDTEDCYEYFMRFDVQAGPTVVPGGGADFEGLQAFHFVIDAYGNSGRHANAHHVQGFYVIAPALPLPTTPSCPPGDEGCAPALAIAPIRSYWRQDGS